MGWVTAELYWGWLSTGSVAQRSPIQLRPASMCLLIRRQPIPYSHGQEPIRVRQQCSIYIGGLVAQAVRHSPPTAGVPSSRLGHSMLVSWWTKQGLGRFFSGFLPFPLPHISFHHFSTLISSISFHIISPCDGASGMVGRHPCYSRTYNIGASLHLIPRPNLVLDTS